MKYLLILAIIYNGSYSFCQSKQETFNLSKDGFVPVVFELNTDSVDQAEIHKRAINWLKRSYQSYEDVLLSEVEGELLRFKGKSSNSACYTSLGIKTCFDLSYTINIDFKKGKIRVSINDFHASNFARHGSADYTMWFKNTGEIKTAYSQCVIDSNRHFDAIISSLLASLNGNTEEDNDW